MTPASIVRRARMPISPSVALAAPSFAMRRLLY
jgi:hypothetical protein